MATDLKEGHMGTKNVKADNWDGKSRPSNKAYDEGWNRIFGTNPIAKAVRTPKFKSQIIKNKKKDNYFDSKSVKKMLDEMD